MFLAFPIHPAFFAKKLPLGASPAAFRYFFLLGHIKLEKQLFNKSFH